MTALTQGAKAEFYDADAATGIVLAMFALAPVFCIIDGLVVSKVWAWFVQPTFGLPHLSIRVAAGIMLLVSFLRPYGRKPDFTFREMVGRWASRCLLVLPLAWAFHVF